MFALTVSYKKEMRPAQATAPNGRFSQQFIQADILREGESQVASGLPWEYGRSLLEAGVRDAGADHGSESVESGL